MKEDHFKALINRLERIEDLANRHDRDLGDAFKKQEELILRIGNLENRIESMESFIHKLPQKTQDKVAEAVETVREETQNLTEAMKEKKVIIIKSKSWIKRLFKRGGD